MQPKIGIKEENLLSIAKVLSIILADEVVLYTKTKKAHWNIEGIDFYNKHLFFQQQYEQLDELVDSIAERIRMLGHYAPASLKEYLELTQLTEQSREKNDSTGFCNDLLQDHETIIIYLRENIDPIATHFKDVGTSDFATGLLEAHEKMAWMLRAHLK
ncbi:starvation-inducible DNA-binding protein [Flavobacterium sp. 7E]|uniref:Dps family protein n=1 Tax=Flavobacterium sp. 7E TaxID=2735898 RepID=UPI00156D4CD3|nr:DNA starvation/stationary phase protection protein [Flavobacterium sp. 7E]NRS87807.1 starvation-inducible DNA-binding protein [Flavobacterium sp. 7E]